MKWVFIVLLLLTACSQVVVVEQEKAPSTLSNTSVFVLVRDSGVNKVGVIQECNGRVYVYDYENSVVLWRSNETFPVREEVSCS